MFKRFFSIICSLLIFFGLFSCSEYRNGVLNIKINEYVNYQEMVNDELKFFEKYNDEKNYVFPLDNLGTEAEQVKYFIGGICYCSLENDDGQKNCDNNTNCENLRNRELFVQYGFNDGNIITLIYKNQIENRTNDFNWIKSNGGNCYRYESNYDENISYILEDSLKNPICGLKMLKENEQLKIVFFDAIMAKIQ